MRRALACVFLLALVLTPSAPAAAPAVAVQASVTSGAAPLKVTLTASGDAASYRWELGDGAVAQGASVEHVYPAGFHVATVIATSAAGEEARAQVSVVALAISVDAPSEFAFGKRARFRGRVTPALPGSRVELVSGGRVLAAGTTRADGTYAIGARVRAAGPYEVRLGSVSSPPATIRVRPELDARVEGSPTVGGTLRLNARLRPAAAGALRVRVWRAGKLAVDRSFAGAVRLGLSTRATARYRIEIVSEPAADYTPVRRRLSTAVVQPYLALGARGPGVRALEERLAELRYALKRVDGLYGYDTWEAVVAFQKVHGLARTGRVTPAVWSAIAHASVPRAKLPGDHIEVSKGRNVLFVVRDGKVTNVVHVSTGATGNTPLGRWRIYRKVGGWDWVLWYPMYFLRGFAIHGYPSVPVFPASHGCVRVPMWIAPQLFASHGYGQTIYVYR